MKQAGINAPAAAVTWTLANAEKWLDACRETADLQLWQKRLQWASAFEAAGVASEVLPMVGAPSIADLNRVHNTIQSRFHEHYGPTLARPSEILIERTIYRLSGTITLAQGRLENARYRRLWLAFRSPRFTRGALRLDLADLGTMHLWEVKPINGLAQGVVQLFYYRPRTTAWLRRRDLPTELIPSPVTLDRPVTRPVRLAQSSGGRQRFALPFERKEIPGIVGYVIVVLPSLKDLQTVAVLEMMRRLARELRKLRGDQAPPTDADLPAGAVVMVLAALILVGAVAALGPAAIPAIGAAISRSSELIGLAARVLPAATALTAGTASADTVSEPGQAPLQPGPPERGQEPATLVTFAGTIECEDAPQALAVLQALATVMFFGIGHDRDGNL